MDVKKCEVATISGASDFDDTRSSYSVESPPPAYHRPELPTVKVAKIIAGTILILAVLIGITTVAIVYIQHSMKCANLEKEQETLLSSPSADALIEEDESRHRPIKTLDSSKVSAASDDVTTLKTPQEAEDALKKFNFPIHIDMDDITGSMMDKNQKARLNCFIEKRRTEEIIPRAPKTLQTPFGNLTTDPKFTHVTGETLALTCRSGNEKVSKPVDSTPPILVLPLQQRRPMQPPIQMPPLNMNFMPPQQLQQQLQGLQQRQPLMPQQLHFPQIRPLGPPQEQQQQSSSQQPIQQQQPQPQPQPQLRQFPLPPFQQLLQALTEPLRVPLQMRQIPLIQPGPGPSGPHPGMPMMRPFEPHQQPPQQHQHQQPGPPPQHLGEGPRPEEQGPQQGEREHEEQGGQGESHEQQHDGSEEQHQQEESRDEPQNREENRDRDLPSIRHLPLHRIFPPQNREDDGGRPPFVDGMPHIVPAAASDVLIERMPPVPIFVPNHSVQPRSPAGPHRMKRMAGSCQCLCE